MNAIEIRNLSKSFKKSAIRREYTSFKTEIVAWLRGKRKSDRTTQIEALKDIDLDIPKGKTVGIVGRNGSGKSTLLKLVTGIYRPSSGRIDVHGRISALLDLGAGFHPDFTGRENILINGIILGMSREEVVRRTPEIIAFSELGEFIDEPVRTYSSGMFMRLAFAVATHVEPEILIVDEILAVGDEHFSRKSRAKMTEFKNAGKTILLVTHDLNTLKKWCDLAVWIDGGRIRQCGDPHLVVEAYRKALAVAEAQQDAGQTSALNAPGLALPEVVRATRPEFGPEVGPDQRWGNFRVELCAVKVLDRSGVEAGTFDPESPLQLQLSYRAKAELSDVGFAVSIRRNGTEVYGTSTFDEGFALPLPLPSKGTIRFEIGRLGLTAGSYTVDVAVRTRSGVDYDAHHELYGFTVQSSTGETGLVRPPHRWSVEADESERSHG